MALLVTQSRTWETVARKALAAEAAGRSANPMDWLFDNPLESYPNFNFGVLRQSYQGTENSACLFGLRKLNPVPPEVHADRSAPPDFTCHRSGTLLPYGADDELDSPIKLLIAIEEAACAHNPALLIYLTLSFPDAIRLHHCWEESRNFAHEAFAQKRHLPAIVIQHRPGAAGSDNPPHVHLLVSPRKLDGTGFRGFARDILNDDGQRILFNEWTEFRERWASRN